MPDPSTESESRDHSTVLDTPANLRVLLANERKDRLDQLATVVTGMGHEVVGRETHVETVGALTARLRPDVAFVGLGESSQHALDHVSAIVREAFCPVIAILPAHDPAWVAEASKCGLYAYLLDERPDELQSALDITLRRFSEYQSLQGAFEQRAEEIAGLARTADSKRRLALKMHDEIVQGLVVAQLAFELGDADEARKTIAATLGQAQAMVKRELVELEAAGYALSQLIGDTVAPVARD